VLQQTGMRFAIYPPINLEATMSNPWKVSAQFAAFVWYTNHEKTAPRQPRAAAKFARDNWVAFLPVADEGLGNLLIKVGSPKKHTRRAQSAAR
jgi:hypothetical protein